MSSGIVQEKIGNKSIIIQLYSGLPMAKYSLSWEEYDEICELLEEVLYVG